MSNIVNKDDDYTQLNLSKSVLSIFTQSISNILLCNTVINRKNTHKLYSREILVSRGTFRVVSDVWITFSMSQWPFVYKYILIKNRWGRPRAVTLRKHNFLKYLPSNLKGSAISKEQYLSIKIYNMNGFAKKCKWRHRFRAIFA